MCSFDIPHVCKCGEPAALGLCGKTPDVEWRCAVCFASFVEPDKNLHEPVVAASAVAVGTGVTITLGAKTARLVASVLDEWVRITTTRFNTVTADPDGWIWHDLSMVSGAANIIRTAEASVEPHE